MLAPFTDDYYRASDAYLSNPVLGVTAPLATPRPDSELEITSDEFPEIVG